MGPESVPAAVSLPRAPFIILVLTLVIVGVLGVLVLNTKITEASMTIDDLNEQQSSLNLQQQDLEGRIAEKEAPGNLEAQAQRLDLVPAGQPGFINPDGTVVGSPQPASGR